MNLELLIAWFALHCLALPCLTLPHIACTHTRRAFRCSCSVGTAAAGDWTTSGSSTSVSGERCSRLSIDCLLNVGFCCFVDC